jgi:hypothetical protein
MNKNNFGLMSAINLISVLMLMFGLFSMPVKAAESEIAAGFNNNFQPISKRITCPAPPLLMHNAQLLRLDYALSDGKGNALGLRNMNSFVSPDSCNLNLRRLKFSLSDGNRNYPGVKSEKSISTEQIGGINLIRLDYALSDGRGGAFEFQSEVSKGIAGLDESTLRRLDFALSDGQGNALGLRDNSSQLASQNIHVP